MDQPLDRDRPESPADRLDSWKEIAVHLKRSVRTVQRWEREQGLPVRRHQHRGGDSVYASASELDAWWARREKSPPAKPPAPVVAVLTFADLGSDPNLEGFPDGLAEEIVLALGQIPGLQVIPRSATLALQGKLLPTREIGRRLDANLTLEGSLRRSGDNLRVAAQLVDVETGFALRSMARQIQLGEFFEAQERIAGELAGEAREILSEKGLLETPPTSSLAVEEACAQGRQLWNERGKESLLKAIDRFQHAIRLDAKHPAAHAGLADCWNMLGYYGYLAPKEAFPKAKKAAQRALSINPRLAEAHASLAFARMFFDWDWSGAEAGFRKALQLRPDYPIAHCWLGLQQGPMGRPFEAIEHIRRAQELDPASPVVNAYVAGAYYFGRQYDLAIQKCRATLEVDPRFGLAWLLSGLACRQKGLHEEAEERLREASRRCQGSADAHAALGNLLAAAGRSGEAARLLDWLRGKPEGVYVSAGHLAVVQVGLGRLEEALDSLDQAFQERYAWLVLAKADPVYDPLRAHPRFASLLRRVGLEAPPPDRP